MDRIDVANATNKTMPIAFTRLVALKTVSMLKDRRIVRPKAKVRISIAYIKKAEMEKLNGMYLKKSSPTDVLSFCYESKRDKIIGEVILCLEMIREFAKEDGKKEKDELKKNIVHGLLHIFGFGHNEAMFILQDSIVKRIK